MKKAPESALAVLACKPAGVCVYVARTKRPLPYVVHAWDREYGEGEGIYQYQNDFLTLADAVDEASRIYVCQVREAI